MKYQFDWVDAFTDKAFGGNGCAVVHDAGNIDAETCMAFTKETGLVECTFLEPSAVADIKIRYFLSRAEIPFAGHPTVASVASLVSRGIVGMGGLTVETGAGVLPIHVDMQGQTPVITMTQVAPQFGSELDPTLVAAVGGLSGSDLVAPPQIVSTGLPFVIAVLRDHETLRRTILDVDALDRLREASGEVLSDVMEPFWVTLHGATDLGRTFSRLLLPPPAPPEDPFTGSATGAMAVYIWSRGLVREPSFTAEQGHWMGRPGSASVEVLGRPDCITGVRVGGPGYVLMQGEVAF